MSADAIDCSSTDLPGRTRFHMAGFTSNLLASDSSTNTKPHDT